MHVQDHDMQTPGLQSGALTDALLNPEIKASTARTAAATSLSDKQSQSLSISDAPASQFNFVLTELLTPEILKNGGLEAAILLLMQERGNMFETTLKSRVNDSKAGQERLLEQTKERIEQMRDSIREMDKAKKSGKISEIFGWVGLATAAVATVLSAGLASPAFMTASVATLAMSAILQIDSATGGKMLKALANGNEKVEMGLSIGLGIMMIAISGGIALAASRLGKTAGTAAQVAGKGANAGQAGARSSSAANAASTSALGQQGGNAAAAAGKSSSSFTGRVFDFMDIHNPKVHQLINNGDHWTQKAAATSTTGVEIAGAVTSVRGAHARFNATKLSATSMEMRAIEKRLSTYMELIGQVIEDVLGQIQNGNRTLAKQLEIAFTPKVEILANV